MTDSRVRKIINLEARADRLSGEADKCRWDAARLIAEELDAGKTQRALADEISKSKSHVVYMALTWNQYGGHHGDQSSFDALYQKAKRGKKSVPRKGNATRGPRKPQKDESGTETQENDGSSSGLPKWMTNHNSDERASEARYALEQIEPAQLSALSWKYLAVARARIEELFAWREAHREAL